MFNDKMINYNYKILLINYFIIFLLNPLNKPCSSGINFKLTPTVQKG